MGYKSLQECVDDLEHHGHLVRIKEEVDPFLEMAAIHLRVYDSKVTCDIKLPLKITGERNIKGQFNVCLQKNGNKISYFLITLLFRR